MNTRTLKSLLLVSLVTAATALQAQVQMSLGPYSQNFDSLATSGTVVPWTDNVTLIGWYASRTNGPQTVYTNYIADAGTSTSGGIHSYGTNSVNPLSERALGSIGSGSNKRIAYGVRMVNNTGNTVSNLVVTFFAELWRNGGKTSGETLQFSYRVSATPITTPDSLGLEAWVADPTLYFFTPTTSATGGPIDGNQAANRVYLTNELTGVIVQPGEEIFLRWFDEDDSGSDHGMAVDDLTVSWPGAAVTLVPPTITSQPQSLTNNAGTTATFPVIASGTSPISYQWTKNSTNLSNGGNIVGATAATLSITPVTKADEGSYSCLLTNVAGQSNTLTVTLTVNDPAINSQPTSSTNVAGDRQTFSVSAGGAGLTYQWRKGGGDISGATSSSLAFTNLTAADAGSYQVVITGTYGAVTSSVANLTIIPTPTVLIGQWNFNDTNSSVASPAPSVGTGTASLLSGVSSAFVSGAGVDPGSITGFTNAGWNTTTYPAQGSGNKTAGAQFSVSTAGYKDLYVTWQERHSGTASKYMRFQYTTNGTDWVDQNVHLGPDSVFAQFTNNLATLPGVNDNPNFAFRIVSEFEDTATGAGAAQYIPVFGTYGSSGTIRFDMVNIFANPTNYSPAPTPVPLSHIVADGKFVISWTDTTGLFKLATGTNVLEITNVISGATSPYTNSLAEPQRYFRLIYP